MQQTTPQQAQKQSSAQSGADSSPQNSPAAVPPAWSVLTFAAIAFLGFLDATYLTVEHYLNQVPPCSILHGCATVTTSVYSTVAGVPIALFGALYYLTVFILAIIYLDTKKTKPTLLKTAFGIITLAFLVEIVLVCLMLFVLHAICLYCMFSALVTTCLFAVGIFMMTRLTNKFVIK